MKESLEQFWQKSKFLKEEVLIVFLIILVGTASFGLGRLSVGEGSKSPVRMISSSFEVDPNPTANSFLANVSANSGSGEVNGKVVASKNGKVYHLPWCPGALKIKPENLIIFDSKQEAESADLTPAANCKGL